MRYLTYVKIPKKESYTYKIHNKLESYSNPSIRHSFTTNVFSIKPPG